MVIKSNDVLEYIAQGGKYVADVISEVYGEKTNEIGEQAFEMAIEIGIKNTIAALYDANVNDKEIIRVMNKYWGINIEEAEKRIIIEKKEATKRELNQHLRLQGLSEMQIRSYMIENKVPIKIKQHQLWNLRHKPELLLKKIQESDVL